ncbi:WPP domain-associated protein isoform X2 [Punica granatum]|uniref:WPP domain-associated protein isoform X2 n=1 Tax=Punica granatum TaxID=22663 RepID=A0A6P8CL54_PUNGR|nr:WPP domain-associated protein isoform X2 [Punica granatum]
MDEFIGELGSRLKVSITESTMMCIVYDAMDRAHGKVKSRGIIARLSEMSRFYELAIIQLEGCLKFVHEEAEAYGLDSSHQDLLLDLAKIRNHLLGRLEESEMAISDKDRELMERVETERRLRQALELKERELESLRAQCEGFDESQKDELKFSELKNSVDQQVRNIKQNLEGADHDDHYDYGFYWASSTSDDKIDNGRIDRMGLDISNLKKTLDLAFGKMQSAIFSSDASPTEQQWRWTIEKDVTASVIKGSIRDILESPKTKMTGQQPKENVDLYDEIQKLKQENEELNLRDRTVGELHVDLLRGLTDEMCTSLFDLETEVQIREGILNTILKEMLALASRQMMQTAIFSFEAGPIEQQWRWAIEKDVTASVIKGSIQDVQESLETAGREENMENVSLYDEVQKLKQENEELKLQERTAGDLYIGLLRGLKDELHTGSFDSLTDVQIREGILDYILKKTVIENKSVACEVLKECNNATENYKTESHIKEEIHHFICQETIRSIVCARNAESNGIVQIEATGEDPISCYGVEKDGSPFDLSLKDQITPNSMREELRMPLEELPSSGGAYVQELSEVVSNFQHNICNNLVKNNTRLVNMKNQVDLLSEEISLLKKRESVYEKAFIMRCHNLQKAETEVDLLGDQVDQLLGLLKMIYMKLCQHSTVFEQYFEVSYSRKYFPAFKFNTFADLICVCILQVSEILVLIENELGGQEARV